MSDSMIELQRTGFFREMPHGAPGDPSLAAARNPATTPHEDRIAAYLDAGRVYMATPGVVHDVLAAGDAPTAIGAPHLLTDGRFVWPADLPYYVRTYHVRLDSAFLEHMLASGWTVPADIDLAALALPAIAPAQPPPQPPPPDLAAVFASFVQSLNAAGVDTEALKQSLGDAGREMQRAVDSIGSELRRAVDTAGGQVRAQLASSLRAMAERAEQAQRTPEAERAERAEDAERRQRVASEVRSTIAARLREHGIEVPGSDRSPDDPDRDG